MTVHELEKIDGWWWPKGIKATAPGHALRHVTGADFAIRRARKTIAIQAGGNVGLWPIRMAPHFKRVFTFEPDHLSFACLEANLIESGNQNVWAHRCALGAELGECSIAHRGLGSHNVVDGADTVVDTIDRLFACDDIGLIQLDVEGFEGHVLRGAWQALERCKPVIQLELRGFAEKYGDSDAKIRNWLDVRGFVETAVLPGNDFVFQHRSTL